MPSDSVDKDDLHMGLMAKKAYIYVMKWEDAKKAEPLDPIEPEQGNAINKLDVK